MWLPFDKEYRVSSPFGWSSWRFHKGMDFATPIGTPVYAPEKGRVKQAGIDKYGGKYAYIDGAHGRWCFIHFKSTEVQTGQYVKKGQLIGISGNTGLSTGPHTHVELKRYGVFVNPEPILNNLRKAEKPKPPKPKPIMKDYKKLYSRVFKGQFIVGCTGPTGKLYLRTSPDGKTWKSDLFNGTNFMSKYPFNFIDNGDTLVILGIDGKGKPQFTQTTNGINFSKWELLPYEVN